MLSAGEQCEDKAGNPGPLEPGFDMILEGSLITFFWRGYLHLIPLPTIKSRATLPPTCLSSATGAFYLPQCDHLFPPLTFLQELLLSLLTTLPTPPHFHPHLVATRLESFSLSFAFCINDTFSGTCDNIDPKVPSSQLLLCFPLLFLCIAIITI